MTQKMNDAISRSALVEQFAKKCVNECDCCYFSVYVRGLGGYCGLIEKAPALDVQPVIHARWIVEKDKAIFCDECCHKLPIVIYNIKAFESLKHHLPKYCPECGAKMDAKGEQP